MLRPAGEPSAAAAAAQFARSPVTLGRIRAAGAFVAVMTAFAAVCMAETRGVPLEAMRELWRAHWFWRGALALTGAGSEHPHRVSASDGGGPQKGPDGAQDGTNGPRGVKRPSAQPLVDGAGGSPPSRGTGQARADKV